MIPTDSQLRRPDERRAAEKSSSLWESEEVGHCPRGTESESLIQLLRPVLGVCADEEIVVLASGLDGSQRYSCADAVPAAARDDVGGRDFRLVANPLKCRISDRAVAFKYGEDAGFAQPSNLRSLLEVLTDLVAWELLGVPRDTQLAHSVVRDFLNAVPSSQLRGVFVAHDNEPQRAPTERLKLAAQSTRLRIEVDASMLQASKRIVGNRDQLGTAQRGRASTRTRL